MKSVVVIGAGIVGASAAHRLSVGGADVTIIDDGRAGAATAAGAGIIAAVSSKPADLRTRQRLIEADAVLVAAGAWSGALSPHARVLPHRVQLVHLRMTGLSDLPILETPAGHYLLTFPGDVVMIGATREASPDFDTDTDGHPTAGGMAQVLAEGMLLVPALRDAHWIGPRVGFRPTSHDGRPYLGRDPDVDGLLLATGMGPSGLTLGQYCGSVIAHHILGESSAPPISASHHPARSR